jgi:hypothetical protein
MYAGASVKPSTMACRYPDRRVAVSNVFLRRNGEWRAVLYQQTVLVDAA